MSDNSRIEWTEATWNIVTGCTKVSEGCDHCYIERTPPFRMDHRRFDKPGIGGTTGVKLWSSRLNLPRTWRKPRRIFVCSLADLFHKDVPDSFIAEVCSVMARCPQHTFQVLTKRPDRMQALLNRPSFRDNLAHWGAPWPLPNVWLGVSVESQQWADIRIPTLLDTPAAVRWLSCEPLLGPVNLTEYLRCQEDREFHGCNGCTVDWVVVGGESGPGARPMHPDWARQLRDQTRNAPARFFFKQWGEWAPVDHGDEDSGPFRIVPEHGHGNDGPFTRGQAMRRVGKKKAGRVLDGRTWNEYPAAAA